jgi:DNA-binding MarR family transcriptional regulator
LSRTTTLATTAAGTLDGRELRAWRGMLEVHAGVTGRLDAEMRDAHGLTLPSYEVLKFLEDAAGGRMRMADIADRVLVSRSGLTRLIDRLVDLGLVERCACPDDGRGAFAQLTAAGRVKIAAARRTHLAGVRRLFLDRLDTGDQELLGAAWDRVLGRERPGPTCGAAAAALSGAAQAGT